METLDKAVELKNKATDFVAKEFNQIQLNVFEVMAGNYDSHLIEHIRTPEPDHMEFIDNYGLNDEFEEYCKDNDLNKGDESSLISFCEEEDSFQSFIDEQENYPMWNTLFEFKEEPSEEVIQAAIDAGFGVIEGMEDFKTTLFVSGCGYSFYGAHWIPLYLALPWNTDEAKTFEGVKFDMM